jgi:hypothetical protein
VTLRVFVEGVVESLASVRVPDVANLAQLRVMLRRIPYLPRSYDFLAADGVSYCWNAGGMTCYEDGQ